MAIAVALLKSTATTSAASAYATGEYTIASGALAVAVVVGSHPDAFGMSGVTIAASGDSLTWTERVGTHYETDRKRGVYILTAPIASGGAKNSTFTFSGQVGDLDGCTALVFEVTGQHASTPVPQVGAVNREVGATAVSFVLSSAMANANSRALVVAASTAGTLGTAFSLSLGNATEKADTGHDTPSVRVAIWLSTDTGVDYTADSDAAGDMIGVAFEIQLAAAAALGRKRAGVRSRRFMRG